MIEKPIHLEPAMPIADEKLSTNENYHPFGGGRPWVGRPLGWAMVGVISIIAILALIPGWIQEWLWMRHVGYSGIFWTLLP